MAKLANNNDGQIVVGLDIPKSVSQINADIKKLEKQLEQVKATGALDTSATVKQINSQIATLQAQLKTITINANIDTKNVQKAGQQIGNQIKNATKGTSIASEILNASDLDKQGKTYILKVNNTIEATKKEIESKLRNAGYFDIEIKGIEKANGQIKSLTVSATNAKGVFEQLNFERAKMQKGGKVTNALVQTDDVKVVGNLSSSIEKVQGNLTTLKNKWEEQGVLVGEFKTKVEQLETSLTSVGSKGELNGLKSQIETLKTEASTIADINKIQLSMSTGGYESKVDSLIGKTNQWVDANGNARISTDALQTAMNNLNTAYANITTTGGNTVANQQALIEAERALDTEVKKVQSSVTSMNATMAKSTAVDSLRQKVQQFYDINTKSHRNYGAQLRAIVSELASGAEVPITRLRQIQQEFIGIQNSARQAGKLGLSFFDTLKQGMKSFSYWTSSTFLVMKAIQEVRQVITTVKELDNAMMDLTMATGYNRNQVEELMDTYYKLGNQLGATATDVAASADTWLRQGKSIAETNKLIEDSMILSKISGLSAEESTKYLTSAMKGYKVATEDVLGVVDKLSAVDMVSATDVGGLAEGMSEVAASADLAGVSMDKLLGYLAIVGETTQAGMSQTGTSFNAIFSRMGNIKLARLKDYQNNGEDLSNVETVLRGEGIVLRDSANEFRNFGEVLDEVAGRWTSFSEVSQRAIASAFAGTHHMNEFIILMENYGKAAEYTEVSLNSSGSAMEKFSAYEETITYHTEQFKNAYQEMSKELLDSSVVKAFVDLGTGVANLVKNLGLLGSIGLGAGIFAGFKNVGGLKFRESHFEYA